jgi:hypothetical protein
VIAPPGRCSSHVREIGVCLHRYVLPKVKDTEQKNALVKQGGFFANNMGGQKIFSPYPILFAEI